MIYITGDKHTDFSNVYTFCLEHQTTTNDVMIILGDAGINYFLDDRDYILKNSLLQYPITFFCIHGNHEERPQNIATYKTKKFYSGLVCYEADYPNILFAKDGEIYNFNDKQVLVIGGAYSVDKEFRLKYGYNWYSSEQPSFETKEKILDLVNKIKNVDVVLTHTCPYKYIPREMFLSGIDQRKVDNSLEIYLDKIEDNLNYKKWYCGHYHIEKQIDNLEFMYYNVKEIEKVKKLKK